MTEQELDDALNPTPASLINLVEALHTAYEVPGVNAGDGDGLVFCQIYAALVGQIARLPAGNVATILGKLVFFAEYAEIRDNLHPLQMAVFNSVLRDLRALAGHKPAEIK